MVPWKCWSLANFVGQILSNKILFRSADSSFNVLAFHLESFSAGPHKKDIKIVWAVGVSEDDAAIVSWKQHKKKKWEKKRKIDSNVDDYGNPAFALITP